MKALQEMTIHMQKQDTAGIWNLAYYLKNRGTQPNTKFFSSCIEDTDIKLPTTQKKRDPNLSTLPAMLDSKISYKKYQVNRSPFKISGTFHLLIFFDRLLQVIPHISQLDDGAENIILHVQAQSNR